MQDYPNVTPHYANVREFMRKAGQDVEQMPIVPDSKTRHLRAKLILEECLETIEALGFRVTVRAEREIRVTLRMDQVTLHETEEGPNLTEIADGCADVSVVVTGTLIACGLPDKQLLSLVDQNNLAKFGPGHSFNEDGKLIKPPGHKPPDLRGFIANLLNSRQLEQRSADSQETIVIEEDQA